MATVGITALYTVPSALTPIQPLAYTLIGKQIFSSRNVLLGVSFSREERMTIKEFGCDLEAGPYLPIPIPLPPCTAPGTFIALWLPV